MGWDGKGVTWDFPFLEGFLKIWGTFWPNGAMMFSHCKGVVFRVR